MPGVVDYAALLQELGSTTFTELRPAQEAALKSYAESHGTTPDLAIELPTGAGKSLIALLICEAWRRDGSTVAVLTGNKTLARQMEAEGKALGVPVERFEGAGRSIPLPRRRKYRRAQAIGVMNYWVMFNQNPVIDSADLLVIDDAHLAESALDSLFSVEIDRYAHQTLFDELVRELAVPGEVRGQVVGRLADPRADDEGESGVLDGVEIGRGQHAGVGHHDQVGHAVPVLEGVQGREQGAGLGRVALEAHDLEREPGGVDEQAELDLRVDPAFLAHPDPAQVVLDLGLEARFMRTTRVST